MMYRLRNLRHVSCPLTPGAPSNAKEILARMKEKGFRLTIKAQAPPALKKKATI